MYNEIQNFFNKKGTEDILRAIQRIVKVLTINPKLSGESDR